MKTKGFTLIEALIASSVFGLVAVTGTAVFMNMSNSEKKTELTNALYEDARVVMEKLATEIHEGTIDYEEYYSVEVLASGYYGINRGVYSSRFYDPGFYLQDGLPEQGTNPAHLGAQCVDGEGTPISCTGASTELIYPLSVDQNTGKNPYKEDSSLASAFCDESLDTKVLCLDKKHDELYLISSDGKSKSIIVNQLINDKQDRAVSILTMEGLDYDKNGVVDIFTCNDKIKKYCHAPTAEEANHPSGVEEITLPKKHNAPTLFNIGSSPFTPFSPLRSTITKLQFVIWPDEDPYKAFAETDAQYQPSVTIIMTLEPSADELANYPGTEKPSVTVQTTISAGKRSQIKTYPPTQDISWIKGITAL